MEPILDLDDILELRSVDRSAVACLIDRLRGSRTPEQLVYRELELDEAWRLLDLSDAAVQADERIRVRRLRDAVMAAHDLVGIEQRPGEAAAVLSEALLSGLAG